MKTKLAQTLLLPLLLPLLLLAIGTPLPAADEAEQKKKARADKQAELMAFLEKHMPDTKAELDGILESDGKKAHRKALRKARITFLDYQDIAAYEGQESADIYLKSVQITDQLDQLATQHDEAIEADETDKAKQLHGEMTGLMKQLINIEADTLRAGIKMLKKRISGIETEIKELENEDVETALADYLESASEEAPSAEETAKKLPAGWHLDPEKAKAAASEHSKPIMAVFSTSWCSPCQAMIKSVYPKEEVIAALDAYIPIYIDGDVYPAVAKKYKIRGYPTFLKLDAAGEVLNKAKFGGINAETFVNWLEQE